MYLISCFGGEQTTKYADVSLEPSGCFQLDQMDKRVSHLNLFKIKIFQSHPLWATPVVRSLCVEWKTPMFSATGPPLSTNKPLGRRENNPLHK